MGDFTIGAYKIGHSSSSSWSNHADEPSQMFAILNWKLKCRVRLVCWSVHFRCSRRRAVACILQRMAARDIFRHFSHVNPGITGMAFHPCCCCCVWCNSCCSCCCCFWCNSCCCWCCFWCNSCCCWCCFWCNYCCCCCFWCNSCCCWWCFWCNSNLVVVLLVHCWDNFTLIWYSSLVKGADHLLSVLLSVNVVPTWVKVR